MASVSDKTAPFDAEYRARCGRPAVAAMEQVFTMAPPPLRRMCGMTARDMLATPKTLTANTRSHSSGVDATTSPTEGPAPVVAEGAQVATIEAMKMNTYVYAPKAGTVAAILVHPGDGVEEGTVMIRLG